LYGCRWKKQEGGPMKRFRGLRGKQRECFEQIAIGRVARHNPRTLAALAEKRLIMFETKRFPLDGLGTLVIDVPYVPIFIHIEWCEWCALGLSGDHK